MLPIQKSDDPRVRALVLAHALSVVTTLETLRLANVSFEEWSQMIIMGLFMVSIWYFLMSRHAERFLAECGPCRTFFQQIWAQVLRGIRLGAGITAVFTFLDWVFRTLFLGA